jgi:hypothetical protein
VVLATAAEVFQAAEDASKKLQTPTHTMDFLLKLGPCLESMKRFSGIIDIFAQSDPAISASVWGCLKLLFLVSQPSQYPLHSADKKNSVSSQCYELLGKTCGHV